MAAPPSADLPPRPPFIQKVTIYTGAATQLDKLRSKGVEDHHMVDCTGLRRPELPRHSRWCTGDSAMIQDGVLRSPGVELLFDYAARALAAQRQQFHARVAFFCNHGKHRSVSMANLVWHVLVESGWPSVDIIHTSSDFARTDCTCEQAPERGHCRAVMAWLEHNQSRYSRDEHHQHMQEESVLRDKTRARAFKLMRIAMHRVKMPLE